MFSSEATQGDVALSPSAHPRLTGDKEFGSCRASPKLISQPIAHFIRSGRN